MEDEARHSREEIRSEELHEFNPILPLHQHITDESVSELYNNLYKVTPESVLFQCIPMEPDDEEENAVSLLSIADQVSSSGSNDEK